MKLFQNPVSELIKNRKSWRTFSQKDIEDDKKSILTQKLSELHPGPFGSKVRIKLIKLPDASAKGIRLGTYGMIKGANEFVVGAVNEGPSAMVDFGYLFECAVLAATDQDLATCWLGGTLTRDAFAKAVEAEQNEIVPAISPLGYPEAKRSLLDRAIRASAGSKKRKTWDKIFYLGNFGSPLSDRDAQEYQLPLEMVRLAPSASNRQPWRIVMDPKRLAFDFYLSRTPGYHSLTSVDLQEIDMGIAMSHFHLTANEQGIQGRWTHREVEHRELPSNTFYMFSWLT